MFNYKLARKTFLNLFDPRAKLILLIGIFVIYFLPVHPLHMLVITGLSLLLSVMLYGFRSGLKPLRTLMVLIIIILVITPLFYRSGKVLLRTGGDFIKITDSGLLRTLKIILRISGLSVLCNIYFLSTELNAFILTLRFFGLPFKGALIISTAIRYIPLLSTVHRQIIDSRKLLGLRARKFIPLINGLTIYSVKQIPILAENLECKGVFRKNRRSNYFMLPSLKKLALDTLISLSIIGLNIIIILM